MTVCGVIRAGCRYSAGIGAWRICTGTVEAPLLHYSRLSLVSQRGWGFIWGVRLLLDIWFGLVRVLEFFFFTNSSAMSFDRWSACYSAVQAA